MNASTKLLSNLEDNVGMLRRPGESIEMMRLVSLYLQEQTRELQDVSEQRQQLEKLRYLESLPDRLYDYPQQRQRYSFGGNSNGESDYGTDRFKHQRSQKMGYELENDLDFQDQYYDHQPSQEDLSNGKPSKDPERMSFAELLWSAHRFQAPSNQQILKELPYTLQGISSNVFSWVEPLPPETDTGFKKNGLKPDRLLVPERKENTNRTENEIEDEDEDDEQTTTVLALPLGLPWPVLGLLNQVMEPAVLYRNIKDSLQASEELSLSTGGQGIVIQALNSAIENELRGYLTLVGVIETEIRRQEMNFHRIQQSQPNINQNSQQPRASRQSTYSHMNSNYQLPKEAFSYGVGGKITLTKSVVLLQEATQGLRLIHTILNESNGLEGGQILSLIHSYTYNGDEFLAKFSKRLLPQVAKPFFDILNQWIVSGRLIDPHGEFFVKKGNPNSVMEPLSSSSQTTRDSRRNGYGNNGPSGNISWDGSFYLDYKYLPDYIPRPIAEKIFQIGKTLHFIAVACDDREWVDRRKTELRMDPSVLYTTELLEGQVSTVYREVVKHLNIILRTKFHLDLHLHGLKDYLLLGKGDFVQLLVESVAPVLDRPAVQLFRHHLTATLETAIRGSNAQFDHAEILKALDARMLELGHGDIGWDVFTLDYRVDKPLDTVILDRKSMTEYLRVFNFLWRIKRVSFTLNTAWRRMTATERTASTTAFLHHPSQTAPLMGMKNSQQHRFHHSVYDLYHPIVGETWQQVRRTCGEMLHFISELEYYINYEVIEMAWGEMISKIGNGELSVDEIISVHKEYLRKITYKGLLGGGDMLMGELHDVLKTILAFGLSIEGLHNVSERLKIMSVPGLPEEEAVRLTGTIGGENGEGATNGVNSNLSRRAAKIDNTIRDLRMKFEQSVKRLVKALGREEDSEMRFLSVRLDFNGFYSRLNTVPPSLAKESGINTVNSMSDNNSNNSNGETSSNNKEKREKKQEEEKKT